MAIPDSTTQSTELILAMDVTDSVNTADTNGRVANGLRVEALQGADTALNYLPETLLWVHPRRKQRHEDVTECVTW